MNGQNADGSQGTNAGAPDAGAGQQDGGNQAPGWIAQLPDDLKGNETFTGFKTIGELAKAHLDTSGKVAELEGKVANAIPKLSENPSDEELAAYRAAIGVPDKPDDYEIELMDGMDNSLAPWFKNVAHQLGMPKGMAKGLSAAWNGMIAQMAKADADAASKAHDAALTELRKTWGADAETNAETVKQGYKFFGDNPLLNDLMQAEITIGDKKVKVGNHPGMVNLILEIGKKVTPDSTVQGGPSHGQPVNNGILQYDWSKKSGG